MTKNEKLYNMAKECSYPRGTKKSKRGYPKGKPKKEYKEALNKAYPDRKGWRAQTKAGASCDVFVGVVVRASGVDKHFTRMLDYLIKYVKKHKDDWELIKNPKKKDLRKGDIIAQRWKTGNGHVSIYMGKNKKGEHLVANAHYYGKSYPVIQLYKNQVRGASRCKWFYAIRPKKEVN